MSDLAAASATDQLISQSEAARLVGVNRRTIVHHIKAGHLNTFYHGALLWSQVRRLFEPEKRRKWRDKLKDG